MHCCQGFRKLRDELEQMNWAMRFSETWKVTPISLPIETPAELGILKETGEPEYLQRTALLIAQLLITLHLQLQFLLIIGSDLPGGCTRAISRIMLANLQRIGC